MKEIIMLTISIIISSFFLGLSPFIGIGLGLYWLSGFFAVKQLIAFDEEYNGYKNRCLDYEDEVLTRLFMFLFGGILALGLFFYLFCQKIKIKKEFKSWFK